MDAHDEEEVVETIDRLLGAVIEDSLIHEARNLMPSVQNPIPDWFETIAGRDVQTLRAQCRDEAILQRNQLQKLVHAYRGLSSGDETAAGVGRGELTRALRTKVRRLSVATFGNVTPWTDFRSS